MELLSDIDYGFNPVTGEFDIPMVEWDGIYGKHWEKFESEEARTKALDEYQKWCEENKAEIEEAENAESLQIAKWELDEIYEFHPENKCIELCDALYFCRAAYWSENAMAYVVNSVLTYNKALLKARRAAKRDTYTIGEAMGM